MSKQFWLILPVVLLAIGGVLWSVYSTNQANQLDLDGSILKVRTYPLSPDATLVIADFRIVNSTGTDFLVQSLEMEMDQSVGEPLAAQILTRRDIDAVFAYQKLSGPQYNDPLIIQDRVPAGETWDRMAVGRIDLPEAAIEQRSNMRIRIREIDGHVAEIAEQGPAAGTETAQ